MTTTNKIAFNEIKAKVRKNFEDMAKNTTLFYVEINRDEIFAKYLEGFDEDEKQEHNCNCCRSFLRQYGGVVSIVDNKVHSIWDGIEDTAQYQKSVENLQNYIHSRPVTDLFLAETKAAGTDKNFDSKRSVVWQHFYLDLPPGVVKTEIPTKLSAARSTKDVLKRGLEELSKDSVETVLEVNAQGSLYRGNEFKAMLVEFLTLQQEYQTLPLEERDNFCWVKSLKSSAVSRVRSSAIGTLLIDLSGGMDINTAVARYTKIVDPTNYKRPTTIATPRMVEEAKKALTDAGLLESLERRYANETDLSVSDTIFSYKPSALTDVFDVIKKEATIDPKSFLKIETVSIEDFVTNVVPTAKSIEILFENTHANNLVTLLTSKEKSAPSIFKWENGFSWHYIGGLADSIKERVKEAGGNVIGELRTSLSWSNSDDLDIHVVEPGGNEIFYSRKHSLTTGTLDVDMNAGGPTSRNPVENIIWTDKNRMKEGEYRVFVVNFTPREKDNQGYTVQIECNGAVTDFHFANNPKLRDSQTVCEFTYSRKDGIAFKESQTKSTPISREKWGIKTNQFHPVTKILYSPNHWEESNKTGNRHYFFVLDKCACDEEPRSFLNEFLKQEFDVHRKVFEVLGSKIKVEQTDHQLAGLGFSDTQRNCVVVKVQGKFTRTLIVQF